MKFRLLFVSAALAVSSVCVLKAQNVIVGSGGIIAQEETGTIGSFGSSDQWGAFGKAPFPAPITGDFPYGQRIQRASAFTLYQMSQRSGTNAGKMDSNIFFGDNTPQKQTQAGFINSRLDFRYLIQDATSGTPSVRQSSAITMIGATSKPVSSTSSLLCFGFPGQPSYCSIRMGIERTNPSYSLDVNGIIRANNVSISSDARFKQDINTIENGISVLANLRGTTYRMRSDADFGEGEFAFADDMESGFIAQEVEEVLPHLVYTDDQGFKSVNYTGVIPYLVEGVKQIDEEVKAEIAAIRLENDELRATNDELMRRLEALENNRAEKSAAGAMEMGQAELFQNVPNPFDRATEIRYFIPGDITNAQLLVFDMNGRQLMSYTLENTGNGSVTIEGNALEAGMYFYSLVNNGEEIATKRMILSK